MSHIPQRKEKNCLNCGTIVQGRFCHVCGQENVEPKESFWHMVTHFFYDITHFDSNFFTTVKDLLFKPGFLSKEYLRGRRASYLHPVRMYVFTSAIFFLLFLSIFRPVRNISDLSKPATTEQRANYKEKIKKKLAADTANEWLKQRLVFIDTAPVLSLSDVQKIKNNGVTFNGIKYGSYEEYDSAEKKLPPAKRDGWITRRFIKIMINVKKKFDEDPEGATREFVESLLHRLPYMLLISLPIFALILKLVYVRRKQFLFVDHGVFTIHFYVFSFLMLLVIFSFGRLQDVTNWTFINWIFGTLLLLLFFYLYKAMRNFYGQRRGKTFIKFMLVALLSMIMMIILFILFMLFSAAML